MAEVEIDQRWVFSGLGNPGKHYELTRHNMGFLVVIAYAHHHGIPMKEDQRMRGKIGKGVVNGKEIYLIMPNTYMNESGQAVRRLIDYYKLVPQQVVVVADDAALPFGELRLRGQGSSGGHNGLKSVETHLGTQNYPRLRIGIGRNVGFEEGLKEYVLDAFTKTESEKLPGILDKGTEALDLIISKGIVNAMNRVNSKSRQDTAEWIKSEEKHEC